MNLRISGVSQNNYARPAFGMAKFTDEGLLIADSCKDVYECLGTPNEYPHLNFFKKVPLLGKPAFAKYLAAANKSKTVTDDDIADTIISCGTSSNPETNAKFIKQLIASAHEIDKTDSDTRDKIDDAIEEVFKKNWDNPVLSKKDTKKLLDMIDTNFDTATYLTLSGVIEKSDVK